MFNLPAPLGRADALGGEVGKMDGVAVRGEGGHRPGRPPAHRARPSLPRVCGGRGAAVSPAAPASGDARAAPARAALATCRGLHGAATARHLGRLGNAATGDAVERYLPRIFPFHTRRKTEPPRGVNPTAAGFGERGAPNPADEKTWLARVRCSFVTMGPAPWPVA